MTMTRFFTGLIQRFQAQSRPAKSQTGRNGRRRGRALRMESLEGRELMAVAVVSPPPTWKSIEFTDTAVASGKLSGKSGPYPVNGTFRGNFTELSGNLTYSSPGDAQGQGTGVGSLTGYISGYGALPVLTLSTGVGAVELKETAGRFSADMGDSGKIERVKLSGNLNTRNFSISGPISFKFKDQTIYGNGTWRSSFAPDVFVPLTLDNFQSSAQWDPARPGVLDVNIVAGGSVQPALNRSAPVATVTLFWGTDAGAPIGRRPLETIRVLWNQATGSYEVSNLPTPPPIAKKLLVVSKVGLNSSTQVLDLPPAPSISINSVAVAPPASGYGDMVFTVTLNGPTDFPAIVRFSTVNGSAVRTQDFVPRSGSLTFLPGGPLTQTITIKIRKDATVANQDFFVKLSSPKWATIEGTGMGTGTIVDLP